MRVGESLGNVVTSGYCNCSVCCGKWVGEPTASGVYPTPNHTIAVDASNPFVPMGTKVVMNSVEYLKAKQELTRKIEIFQETHEQILEVTAKERDLMKEIQRVKQEEEAVL